jgi:hypothetical protein
MSTNVKIEVDRFYDDMIAITDDTSLSFHREYRGRKSAVVVSLIDSLLESTTILATYIDGVWKHPNHRSASLFWNYAKTFNHRMRRIIHKLSASVPEDLTFKITWRCFERKLKSRYRSTLRNLKSFFN